MILDRCDHVSYNALRNLEGLHGQQASATRLFRLKGHKKTRGRSLYLEDSKQHIIIMVLFQ
jgi:hypothetical protein